VPSSLSTISLVRTSGHSHPIRSLSLSLFIFISAEPFPYTQLTGMVFAMIVLHTRPRLRSLVLAYSTKAARPSNSPSSESTSELIRILNHRGDYTRAFQIFDNLVQQKKNITIVSLLALVETCSKANQFERGRQIETLIDQSIEWKNHLRLQTSLINMYMKCQQIDQGKLRTRQASSE
jgi:hypothetical protein